MNIILAKTAGFCFGVKRAVDMAYKYEHTYGTYTFGPIIHNDAVINQLKEKGIHPVESIENEEIHTLIIRSHGVVPKIYEEAGKKQIQIVDATCPYVKKIHRLARQYFEKGYQIIIVGNKVHPEVEGINGWVNNEGIIVKDVEELKQLPLSKEEAKYLLVAQTTYKKDIVNEVKDYLEKEGYDFKYINTICNATKERQEEAVEIAKRADCMLIIGSPYSSNTLKLYEICKSHCDKSYCIAEAEELTEEMIMGCAEMGITAGASTPDFVIDEVIKRLLNRNT